MGLPADVPEGLTASETLALDDTLEVRLYVLPGDEENERHVLAGFRDGKRIWARLVSSEPYPSVREVSLGSRKGRMGEYGWLFSIFADWSGGYEHGHVYVDREGAFLFYFLSW